MQYLSCSPFRGRVALSYVGWSDTAAKDVRNGGLAPFECLWMHLGVLLCLKFEHLPCFELFGFKRKSAPKFTAEKHLFVLDPAKAENMKDRNRRIADTRNFVRLALLSQPAGKTKNLTHHKSMAV
jgi:hypothetical protein